MARERCANLHLRAGTAIVDEAWDTLEPIRQPRLRHRRNAIGGAVRRIAGGHEPLGRLPRQHAKQKKLIVRIISHNNMTLNY